jgi:uncharacterized protein
MPEVFIDTAGWVCHLDASQPQHVSASTLIGVCLAEGRRLVTSSYVLVELVAVLTIRRRVARTELITSLDTIRNWNQLTVVHVDAVLDEAAWALLRSRPDKGWSLTDCVSFELMRSRGIREALTTDRHFEQAGFVRLLRP